MTQNISNRESTYPINKMFIERWSPRNFSGEVIAKEQLLTILEAGRWAPSAYNVQPWRFIYAFPNTAAWDSLFSTLVEFNQLWAAKASVLVLLISANESAPYGGAMQPNPSHSMDAGTAWANVTLQAHLLGWATHGMTGFDKDLARSQFKIPDSFSVEQIFAIGRIDPEINNLPEKLRKMEIPNQRKLLTEIVAEGEFNFK